MKLNKLFAILPLALPLTFATSVVSAEEAQTNQANNAASVFEFSTEVSRTVDKDLMQASVYSRKTGKDLAALKKSVSENLNRVLEFAKTQSDVEVQADGISNYASYDDKGKITGWVAEGYINLKSKNFEQIAKILENLGSDVAISNVNFTVSKEKLASLEDEMTLEIIEQFKRKASVIQKGINAKGYVLTNVQLNTPNGRTNQYEARTFSAMAKAASDSAAEIPLEAGKETITATAAGKVKFE